MHVRTTLLLALAACGGVVGPRSPDADVRYTLDLVSGPAPELRITVATRAAPGGTTAFEHETWGGVDATDRVFQDVTARVAGRSVAVDRSEHGWSVHAAAGTPVALTYVLRPALDRDTTERRFFPMVSAHAIHLFGDNALAYPSYLDDGRRLAIELRWTGFAEAGWTTLSSCGSGPATVDTDLEAFRDAVFLASDRIAVARRTAGGATLVAAVVADAWTFPTDTFADVTARLMDTESAFFGDAFPKSFLADLVPFRVDGFTGGSALHDAFTAQASPRTLTRDQLAGLFAHELFHNWNGRVIQPEVDDGEKWFTEGFTSFYARRLAYRAGLTTLERYRADLDTEIRNYMLSPARNASRASADEAGHAFWQNSDAEQSSYTRGDLVAAVLDVEIRRVSHGRRSLDDVMRDLLAAAKAGSKVTADNLLARFARETSPAFAERLRGVIERGETIEIDPELYAPCFHGVLRDLPRFDLGFDFQRSQKAGRVTGLREGSSAAAAGLREGDELVGWSFYNDQVDQTVKMQIKRGTAEQTVAYAPAGEPVRMVVFERGDERTCPSAGL